MLKYFLTPPFYSLIQRGKVFLLLKQEYKDLLLQQGIEDFKTFLKRYGQISSNLKGRTLHLSALLKDGQRMVIRRYSHGGWLRFLTRDLYLFGSRSFQELGLIEEIRSSGIPTVRPIGAIHASIYLFLYKAYFLSLQIPGAEDLTHYLLKIRSLPSRDQIIKKRKIIRDVANLIRRFHREGFYHGDLQLKNILVAENRPLLIDFDRSYRKKDLTLKEKIDNLLRLNRSVEKWKRLGLPLTKTDRWRFFLDYAEGDPSIREALGKALRTYSIHSSLHRCIWTLQEVTRGPKGPEAY